MTTTAFIPEQMTSAAADSRPVEVGAWTLDYLGPGFHAQVRIAGRGPTSHVSGWTSPAINARIFLVPMARRGTTSEAVASSAGRFEFTRVPSGAAYRLAFLTEGAERPFMTPPFWV
jgi:hypothetical protein